jgi:hypothetical protein
MYISKLFRPKNRRKWGANKDANAAECEMEELMQDLQVKFDPQKACPKKPKTNADHTDG